MSNVSIKILNDAITSAHSRFGQAAQALLAAQTAVVHTNSLFEACQNDLDALLDARAAVCVQNEDGHTLEFDGKLLVDTVTGKATGRDFKCPSCRRPGVQSIKLIRRDGVVCLCGAVTQ